jgi:hypothetical protein
MTCCYCGARSTLGKDRIERLVCHGCGAPMSKIAEIQSTLEKKRKKKKGAKPAVPHGAERSGKHLDKDRPARRRKGKRRRSAWYHVAEAFDDLDDWFEEITDIFD